MMTENKKSTEPPPKIQNITTNPPILIYSAKLRAESKGIISIRQ